MDVLNKKHVFEDLSKDELIGECRNLLSTLKEAIIAKDLLQDEVQILKLNKDESTVEVETFTIDIETINTLQLEKACLVEKNNALTTELENTNKRNDVLELETRGFQQQLERFSAENGQLLETHLNDLGKQNECFNKVDVEQRQQLPNLEQTNVVQKPRSNLKEMLNRSLDKVKKSQYENDNLNSQVRQLLDAISNEHLANSKFKQDLENSQQLICALEFHLIETRLNLNNVKRHCQEQHTRDEVTELEVVIGLYKREIEAKSKELESVALIADDLNTALHKNKALVEVLQSKIRNTTAKLSDNQIVSSSLTADLENKNEKLRGKNKLYYGKMIKFAMEIRKLKMDKENVLIAFKNYNSNVKSWKEKLEKLSVILSIETTRNNTAFKNSQLLMENFNSQSNTIELLNIELKGKNEEPVNASIIQQKAENLYPIVEQFVFSTKETQTELTSKSNDEVFNLKGDNDKLKATIVAHKEDILNLSNSLKSSIESTDLTDVSKDCIEHLKCEHADLLIELNLLNQQLRKRGESISQHEYEHLLKKQEQNEINFNKLLFAFSEKDQIIFSLQKLNNNFLENAIITNDFAGVNKDCMESDTMSYSTISRTEELGRFKDLDTSLEDRYCRLRSLALKQKNRIRELTVQLTDKESINNNLNLKHSINMQLVQTLQGQCGAIQEELDRAKAESTQYLAKLNSIAEEIAQDKIALATNEDIINALRTEVEGMDIDKAKTELWKKQVSIKVQSLKKELEANCILKRDFKTKLADLNNKLDQKDRLLREEINRHIETKNNFQDFTNDCKKQSLLKLEMQDYERTGKELNVRLEKRTEEYNKLLEDVNLLNQTSNTQLDQIQLLEAQVIKLEREAIAGRQEITNIRKKCVDLETAFSEKELSVLDLMGSCEEAKRESEDLNIRLSKVTTGELKSLDSARNERDALQLQILGLEQRLTEVDETKRLIDLELSNIKSEYDSYKVRAQSVLRENHSRDIGLDEKISQETESLKNCMDIIQRECEELRNSLSEFKMLNEDLKMQNFFLDNKILDLQHKMEFQNEKYNVLTEQYNTAVKDHSENTRTLKAQTDTLASCYRSKLSELESRHSQEILHLQAYVDESSLFQSSSIAEHLPTLGAKTISPLIAREAAEGSENADNMNTISETMVGLRAGTSQHPLQQLLDIDSSYPDVTGLRRQLMERDSRVTHLTELLADTEQDLAKHVQMNLVLKDEIRRQQRSVEREEHAKNLEYMKNIILKFITSNNGDERQRLVPVLNNILRLSTDEMQQVYAITKGNDRGWSTYLPAWSKPQ